MSGGSTTWSSRLTIHGISVIVSRSSRRVSCDRRAMERAFLDLRVADRRVLRATVVPDHQIADLPAMPPRVLEARELRVEVLEQRRAVFFRPAIEVLRVVAVHEQGAAAGLGMCP